MLNTPLCRVTGNLKNVEEVGCFTGPENCQCGRRNFSAKKDLRKKYVKMSSISNYMSDVMNSFRTNSMQTLMDMCDC